VSAANFKLSRLVVIVECKNIDRIVHAYSQLQPDGERKKITCGALVRSALNYRLRNHTSPTGTTLHGKPISCNGRSNAVLNETLVDGPTSEKEHSVKGSRIR
jgi:hypothetical protein